MGVQNDWGNDPSVQRMRRVFARMEILHKELIGRLNLSPLDERLRRVRELACNLFERAWPFAEREGLTENEEDAATLYLHCFLKILNREGIKIPSNLFSGDEKVLRFLSEKFQ
jgi:hypothetical protein